MWLGSCWNSVSMVRGSGFESCLGHILFSAPVTVALGLFVEAEVPK